MAQFLTTHQIAAEIDALVRRAAKRIVLVSSYLNLPRTLCERLADAAHRGVATTLVYGKTEQYQQEALLSSMPFMRVLFLHNLHAKMYLSEERLVIGSLNLIEYSEKNNREAGVLLTPREDAVAFQDGVAEIESILRVAEVRLEPRPGATAPWVRGYCVRCRGPVDYDPHRPLCPSCYRVWADFRNPDYGEEFCHACGQPSETSVGRPLCAACLKVVVRADGVARKGR